MCSRGFGLCEKLADESVEEEQGSAGRVRGDFDVLPGDAAAPSGLQGFKRGFFCCEACGIMLGADDAATVAVSALGLCVNALDKARRAVDDFTHATNFDNVYANGNNHGRN